MHLQGSKLPLVHLPGTSFSSLGTSKFFCQLSLGQVNRLLKNVDSRMRIHITPLYDPFELLPKLRMLFESDSVLIRVSMSGRKGLFRFGFTRIQREPEEPRQSSNSALISLPRSVRYADRALPATRRDDEPGPSNDSSSDHGGLDVTEETNTNSLHTQEAVAGDLVQASEDAPPSKKRKCLFQS